MQYEQHSAKKISKDKRVLANTEFGGGAVKGMLYGGGSNDSSSPQRHAQQLQHPNLGDNPRSFDPAEADIRGPPDLHSTKSDGMDIGTEGKGGGGGNGENGFAALLSKSQGMSGSNGPQIAGNPFANETSMGSRNPYMEVDDGPQMGSPHGPQDPELVKKAQQFDELSSMYADMMEEQRAMREAIAEQSEEMKKVKEREKTLRAGQRGGMRKSAANKKPAPARDAGGRVIRNNMGGGENKSNSGLLRTQSARRRGEEARREGEYERGSSHYLSPGRRKGPNGKEGKKSINR